MDCIHYSQLKLRVKCEFKCESISSEESCFLFFARTVEVSFTIHTLSSHPISGNEQMLTHKRLTVSGRK